MSAAARAQPISPRRRALIAKVKIGAKALGLDDDTYRAVLQRVAKHRSAADCTEAQLTRVVEEFRSKGWDDKARPASRPRAPGRRADHPSAKKARALWISLHQLGVVRQREETALEAFAARQLGVERLQWADQAQVYKLIEALKAMAERAGWSQDLAGVPPELHVVELKRRLANALKRAVGEPELGPGWLGHEDQLNDVIAITAARLQGRAP